MAKELRAEVEITNVGLAMDTLVYKNGVVSGGATIYSTAGNFEAEPEDDDEFEDDELDFEDDELDFEDDVEFTYDTKKDVLDIKYKTTEQSEIFKDAFYIIKGILIDNLKTNYLHK